MSLVECEKLLIFKEKNDLKQFYGDSHDQCKLFNPKNYYVKHDPSRRERSLSKERGRDR